jgi:hypothetical protein
MKVEGLEAGFLDGALSHREDHPIGMEDLPNDILHIILTLVQEKKPGEVG